MPPKAKAKAKAKASPKKVAKSGLKSNRAAKKRSLMEGLYRLSGEIYTLNLTAKPYALNPKP